jgi:hypothetical protein
MKLRDEHTLPLPLLGGVVQAQRLVVPPEVVRGIKSWRHACRLAWKLRHPRITQRTLAEGVPGLYQSHVSDYFSTQAHRRELPAKQVAPAHGAGRAAGGTCLEGRCLICRLH